MLFHYCVGFYYVSLIQIRYYKPTLHKWDISNILDWVNRGDNYIFAYSYLHIVIYFYSSWLCTLFPFWRILRSPLRWQHRSLWSLSHQEYFDRIGSALGWIILNRSQLDFIHFTTVTLSWCEQNFVVIDGVHFNPEHGKFWSNLEFEWNIVTGTGAGSF